MYCSTPSLPSETPHCHARRLSLLTPLLHPQSLKRATALIQPSFACCLWSQLHPLGISMYMRVTSFGQEIVKGGTTAWAGRVQRSNNDAPVGQSLPQARTQQATPLSSHTRSTPSWPSAQWLSPAMLSVTSSSTTPSCQSAASSCTPASPCSPVCSAPACPVPYSEPPQIVSMVNLPLPHPRLPLECVRPLPVSQTVPVVDISSSDEDDNTSLVGYTSSWVQTPIGSPHVLPLEVNNPVVPAPLPCILYRATECW